MTMFQIKSFRKLIVTACVASSLGGTVFADDETLRTSTNGFDMAYSMSFLMFDVCGEGDVGKWYRDVVIAQVESCPLTADAKERFYKLALRNTANVAAEAIKLVASHSSLPDTGDVKCAKLDNPEFKALREKLSQYHSGKISLSEAAWASCEEGSAEGAL